VATALNNRIAGADEVKQFRVVAQELILICLAHVIYPFISAKYEQDPEKSLKQFDLDAELFQARTSVIGRRLRLARSSGDRACKKLSWS
jgi:hypothetical protein